MQKTFNPVDFGFKWTDGWYEFNVNESSKLARKARDKRANELKKAGGHTVKKWSMPNQRITMGGMNHNQPEITVTVTVYCLEY